MTRAEKNYKERVASIPDQKNPVSYEAKRTDRYRKKTLKKITKWEAKALLSDERYGVSYSSRLPDDDVIEEFVVYVVEGGGDPISSAHILDGIRYDAFYVWDKEKDMEDAMKETETRLDKIHKQQVREAIHEAVAESFANNKELCDATGVDNEMLRIDLEEHNKLREEAKKRWVTMTPAIDLPTGSIIIKPTQL